MVKHYRVRRDEGPGGVAMPPERRTRPSYMRGGVLACPQRRHASPGCAPAHGRRSRRHLKGETDASDLHGGDLTVGLALMLL